LVRLQAVEITDARWEYDFGILVNGIMKFGKQTTQA
jgi:hypothetical protein